MKNKFLTKEIIRHIFSCFGLGSQITQPVGLIAEELILKKTINICYDNDEIKKHHIYAGEISFQESKFRALVIDLTLDVEYPEYCLLFRLDSFPLHGLRMSYDEDDWGVFRIFNDKQIWVDAPIAVQSMALNGIERINSYGFLWQPCLQFEDLYQAAIILAEMV